MAKRKGPNKSAAIRDYLASNPNAKPKEIVEAMSGMGIKTTAAFVSTIKSKFTSSGGAKTKRRGRPAKAKSAAKRVTGRRGRPAKAASAAKSDAVVTVDALVKAKKLVTEMGSVSEARAALNALEKLLD